MTLPLSERGSFKELRLKIVRRILFLPFIVLTFLAYLLPVPSNAASVTDTITLKVGYFGGPYYEKVTYNWKQLDDNFGGALDSHQVAYSYNSGSRTAIDSARGFYLSDLLEYAGIDVGSVSSLSFYTKDQEVGAFATFPKSSLLDSARYYFPNISMNADKQLVPLNGGDLTDGAVRVDAMMALEDSWEWDAVDSNFTNLSPTSRFRLVFGQTGPTEVRTSQSAKYVHTIYVTFAGAPVMSTDQDNLSMKVGSDYQVKVKLGTADPVLDKNLGGSIKWSSSDTSVVTVDGSGNLTAVSNGSAVITAATGKTSMSVKVSVGDGVGTGNGLGSGTGTGSGSGSGSGNGDSGRQTASITGKAGTNSPAAGTEPKSSDVTAASPSPSAKPAT